MKTRIWKVKFRLEDTPEYSEHGEPEKHLLKKEVLTTINNIDLPAGTEIVGLEIKPLGYYLKVS